MWENTTDAMSTEFNDILDGAEFVNSNFYFAIYLFESVILFICI